MPQRPLKRLLPIALCAALILAAPATLSAGQARRKKPARPSAVGAAERRRRDELARRLHGLRGKMHGVRETIHSKKVQEVRISESIGVVETRIAKTRAALNGVNSQLETLDGQHEKVVDRLELTRDRLAHEKEILAQRLRSNYQRRNTTYLQTLLQSGSLHELLSRAYLVRLIVKSDAELIRGIQGDVRQIDSDRRTIETQEAKEKRLAAELEVHKRQLADDVGKRRVILHGVQAARVEAEQELDELEAEAGAMTGRIRALTEQLRRQEEAARQAAIRAAQAARREAELARRQHRKPRAMPRVYSAAPVWHGGFIRPCSGPLTSGFGMRFHPILHRARMHTGVDFGAGYGAPIRAAAAGVVLLSAYNRGYGNCIILYHGSGVSTLYGHCSARLVRQGESVRQGQQIARVGATGLATGPHLHFEVRRNGTPVAPY